MKELEQDREIRLLKEAVKELQFRVKELEGTVANMGEVIEELEVER